MYVFRFKVELFTQFNLVVAVTAINWPVFTGFKRNFSFRAALSAYYGVHFPWCSIAISTITIALCFP